MPRASSAPASSSPARPAALPPSRSTTSPTSPTVPSTAASTFGRIVDRDDLGAWLTRERPALAGVVHLGACTDTRELDVAYLTRVNLEYSQMLWAYCTAQALPLGYASSAATYGDGANGYDDDEIDACSRSARRSTRTAIRSDSLDLWALAEERVGAPAAELERLQVLQRLRRSASATRARWRASSCTAPTRSAPAAPSRLFKSHRAGIADGHRRSRDFVSVGGRRRRPALRARARRSRAASTTRHRHRPHRSSISRAPLSAALGAPERIEFIDMPVELRERYQYFTEARTARLRAAGYRTPFTEPRGWRAAVRARA